MLPNFAYVQTASLKEAVDQLNNAKAWAWAGGSDLMGCLRERAIDCSKVVSISRLAGLQGIEATDDGALVIGALTTIATIAHSEKVQQHHPGLAQAALAVASPQIRNQGTIGGNLCQKPRCWYWRGEFTCLRHGGEFCSALQGQNQFHAIFGHDGICVYVHPSDPAPMLAALGAEVHITGPKGRRKVPVAKLYVAPAEDPRRETVLATGEVITHIQVPAPRPGQYSAYRKVRTRRAWDFSLSGLALNLVFNDGRVERAAVWHSGVAPVPWRAKAVEEIITGERLDDEVIARAAAAAVKGAEPLSMNEYKVALTRGVVTEELEAARQR